MEDFRFHGPDGSTINREELWSYLAACRAAFDEFQASCRAIFSDGGDYVAARTTFSGIFARRFEASPVGPLVEPEQVLHTFRRSYQCNRACGP